MRYAVVIEKAKDNYCVYVPDLPGCIATGVTVKEAQQRIAQAIKLHIKGLEHDHLPVPEPATVFKQADAPATKKEILSLRKSFGGLAIAIGVAYFLLGLAAFVFPRLDDRPLTLVGVGLAIWIAGRSLQHSALAQEGIERIERYLAAQDDSVSATVETEADPTSKTG
ncbi:MAG: type II toxin-antitoxin system HicB family antitoxin [Candidatus Binataceae bacterium]